MSIRMKRILIARTPLKGSAFAAPESADLTALR
jgi:hypothetical protein